MSAILWSASLNRFIYLLEYTLNCVIRMIGPMFVFLAVSLISMCAYVYYWIICPLIFDTNSLLFHLNVLLSLYILILTFFNYFACLLVDPGKVIVILCNVKRSCFQLDMKNQAEYMMNKNTLFQ